MPKKSRRKTRIIQNYIEEPLDFVEIKTPNIDDQILEGLLNGMIVVVYELKPPNFDLKIRVERCPEYLLIPDLHQKINSLLSMKII